MALERDVYREFEDVVGAEYICDDPAIMPSYHGVKHAAVVLPANTAQVQSIIKLCNKHKLRFSAVSTAGQRMFRPGIIKIDLRRMNRIIEINEKNMYAVVEPYVIGAQLQAECMKRGLICNQSGAGANCSAPPIAAHAGYGHLSQSASYGERNQLALEWVTPDGEIVRLGSLGSSDAWFCGDGPGPSLRGIVRGNVTPLGGLGVFTKAATKLYPWPGPAVFPIEGISPHYSPNHIPEGFMIRFFSFPSLDNLDEAQRRIGESEIAYELMGFNPAMAASNIATSNEEMVKLFKEFSGMVHGPCCMVIIAGDSPNDFEYKTKVLTQIAAETGGKSLEKLESH